MSGISQCRYMAAAYPTLSGEDTCGEHRHDEPTFALARAMAAVWQQSNPTEEQVGWMLDDSAAVVDDFAPLPDAWEVSEMRPTEEVGLDFTFTINDRPYVVQPSEWEPSHPVSRAQWEAWQDEDCDHEWEVRPESDTRECVECGAER